MSYGGIAHAQRFEDAYHLGTFQNDDKQSADHGESGYCHHQCKDNPDIDVEQREPLEYVRIGFIDGLRGDNFTIAVGFTIDIFDNVLGCLF